MARQRDYDDEYEDDRYDEEYDDLPRRGRGGPPQNYLVPAILVTLCCCIPGGIVAIINATQVNSKWAAGDYEGAQKASDTAKQWCIISAVVGLVVGIISGIVQVAMQGGGGR